jgi:hypothetical protein
MSDTPRTDALSIPSPLAMEKHYIAMREHARQLERELNDAKRDAIRALSAQLRQQKGTEQNDR